VGGYTTDAMTWLSHFWTADVASDGHLKCEDDGPSTDTRPSDFMLDHLRAFAAYDTTQTGQVVTRTEAVISEFTSAYSSSYGLLSDFVVKANTTGRSRPRPTIRRTSRTTSSATTRSGPLAHGHRRTLYARRRPRLL